MKIKYKLIATFLFFCIAICSSKGQKLAFEGYFESRYVYGGNGSTVELSSKFSGEVDFQEKIWHIDDLNNPPRTTFTYSNALLDRDVFNNPSKTEYESSLPEDDYPIDLDSDQRLVWFVYCAKNYLTHKDGQPVILPYGEPRQDLETHASRAKIQWHSDASICPSEVQFIVDQNVMKAGIQKLSYETPGAFLNERQSRIQKLFQWMPDGSTNAEFTVTAWTNISGIEIPKNWQFRTFFQGDVVRICTGGTSSAKLIDRVVLPTLPQVAEIRDKRARDFYSAGINAVIYIATNGQLRTKDEVIKLSIKHHPEYTAVTPPSLGKTRAVFISLLLTTLALPLIVLMLKFRKRS